MESPINANEHERKHWHLGHDIMGAFYGVYNELGHGSREAVDEEALAIGLREAGFTVARHREKGIEVGLLLSFGPMAQFQGSVFENNRKGIRVHSREFATEK